jgi:transposase
MEATGIYSMPVYHALLEHGKFEKVLVCNAAHVKNVPGRKTDMADAEWLAHLLECGLLRGGFIPPADVKAARDVVRYRAKVVQSRTSEIQRLGAVLQDDLLTELPSVSASQPGARHGSRPPGCPKDPNRQAVAALSSARSPQKPDIQGLTGRLPSPRCRFPASTAARLEWSCSVRDLLRHAKLATRLALFREAGIKIDSVASSITTKSGRAMIEALIDGERRSTVLADLARGRMRVKIPDLQMALEGRFDDHHALMCQLHLDHIDHLEAMIAKLGAQVEQMMEPFRAARDLLTTIPGIGPLAAAAVISETGADVRQYFPGSAHLASWAGMCPANNESAGRHRPPGAATATSTCSPCWWSAPGRPSATPATSSPCITGT